MIPSKANFLHLMPMFLLVVPSLFLLLPGVKFPPPLRRQRENRSGFFFPAWPWRTRSHEPSVQLLKRCPRFGRDGWTIHHDIEQNRTAEENRTEQSPPRSCYVNYDVLTAVIVVVAYTIFHFLLSACVMVLFFFGVM